MIQSLPKRDESTIYICIFMQSPVFICGSFALYIDREITKIQACLLPVPFVQLVSLLGKVT